MSVHWTDEELIAHQYGIGPEDTHLRSCSQCQSRLASMQQRRAIVESAGAWGGSGTQGESEFFAAQRRKVYAKITEAPGGWWAHVASPRWITAAASLALLSGGMLVYEKQNHQGSVHPIRPAIQAKISDAQLAVEVSDMSQDLEPKATAPLQELFDE